MRKLSLEETAFGMVEGKEYGLFDINGNLYRSGKFHCYFIQLERIEIFFALRYFFVYDIRLNRYDIQFKEKGYYFATED
jgi:hypothetical protein